MLALAIKFVIAAVVAGLLARGVLTFIKTTGTLGDRLAAGWKDSLTLFFLGWGVVLSTLLSMSDMIGSMSGDPQFMALADGVKAYIPVAYQPLIPIAFMLLSFAARMRTLGK